MATWLLKTEPDTYSFADLQREKRTTWDGVANAVALKHLRAMTKGDEVLVYHTGKEKRVVGLAKIVGAPRPDPKDAKLVVVDIAPARALESPVTLADMRANAKLEGSA